MKKKKGFTLIELLAVIVILAVIAVIAVPMVLNTIEKARKGAFEQTLNGVVKAVDLYKAQIQMTDELSECRYFSFGSDVTEVTVRDGKTYYPLKELSIKGKLPTEGEIKVCRNELLIDASDGSYSGRYEDEKLNITKGDLASSDLTTPIIDIFNITSTTDKIIVTVAAHSQSVGGIITNYYYKIDDGKYNKTTEPSYVFEKLKAGQEYTITIMVENKSGITTEESKKITTKSFGELTIEVEEPNEWTSSKNVTINGTTEEYKIEYKIRKYNEETKEIEESEFIEYKGTFKLETMATTEYPILIIARYNNNGTYSNEKTYTVVNIDTTSPTNTKPVVNVSTTKPTSEASVIIRQADTESGLDESTIEYGYSTNNVDYTWQASSELKKLKSGTKYYVKTKVTNNVGKTVESEVTEYTPGEITTCNVAVPSGWATSKTVTITGVQTGAELQYQVGATIENGWNTISNQGTVKIEENTSVYCRLWDGTTAGGKGTGIVEGIDKEKPSIPTSTIRYGSLTGTVRENSDSWSTQNLWWGEFNSTDNNGSGIDHYEYSTGCTGTKSGDLSTSGYLYQNGTNDIYCIRAVDKVGNISEWSQPYYFKVDTALPQIVVKAYNVDDTSKVIQEKTNDNININEWKNFGYKFIIEANDNESGLSTYNWEWNESGNDKLDTTLSTDRMSTTDEEGVASVTHETAITVSGARYAKITMIDKAGNSRSVTVTVYIDTKNPSLLFENVSLTTNSAAITYAATDTKSGIDKVTCKYSSTNGNYTTNGTIKNNECTLSGLMTGKTYYYQICVTDKAGNGPICKTGSTDPVEMTKPSITFTNTPETAVNGYLESQVATVTYISTGITSPRYFVKTTRAGTSNLTVTKSCGTGNSPSTSCTTITGTTTLATNTWYEVSGNVKVTYNTYSNTTGTIYAAIYDGTNFIDPIPSGTLMKITGPANYTVRHHQMNTDMTNYTLAEIQTISGKVGYSVTPSVKTYTGFNSPSTKTVTVAADGSTAVDYYYTRKQVVVTFYRNTSTSDTTTATQTFTYGVSGQSFSAKGWTRSGYTHIGWSESSTGIGAYSVLNGVVDSWINGYAPNTKLYAVWVKNPTITFANNPSTLVNGYAKSSVATVTYSSERVTNPVYYIRTTKQGTSSVSVTESCGTSTAPGTCTAISSTTSLAANTWYKISGNTTITYNTSAGSEATITAYTYDGTTARAQVTGTGPKIDATKPELELGTVSTTTNSATIVYTAKDTESGANKATCKYSATSGSYTTSGTVNSDNNACTLSGLETGKTYYYQICVSDKVGNGTTCKAGNTSVKSMPKPNITFTNTPETPVNGYLDSQVAKVTYTTTGITSPRYFVKTTRKGTSSLTVTKSCGTGNLPTTSCTTVTGTTTLTANTWYEVSGNVNVTYNEYSASTGTIYAAIYDGTNFIDPIPSGTLSKITKSVNYTVKHHQMNTDMTNYTLAETETLSGKVGYSVTPSVKTYTGFNSPSTKTVTVAADGSTVVDYYYTRKQVVVTFYRNTSTSDTTTATQTFTYGVSGQSFSDKGWTRSGWVIAGWAKTSSGTANYTKTSGVTNDWINTNAPSINLYMVWVGEPSIEFTNTPTSAVNGYLAKQVATVKYPVQNIVTPNYYIKTTRSGVSSVAVTQSCGTGNEPGTCTTITSTTTLAANTWYKISGNTTVTYSSAASSEATLTAYVYDGTTYRSKMSKNVSKIDTTTPTVSIEAVYENCVSSSQFNNCGSAALMSSGTWYASGVAFRLTQGTTVGGSGATIKYCKDTANTCTPNITVSSGASITDYKNVTGTYYIRYQITSGVGKASSIGSYTAKVDTTGPSNTAPTVKQHTSNAKALVITSNQAEATGESGLNTSTLSYGYSTDNSTYTWQSSNTFSSLTAGTTYYFKTKIRNNAGTLTESNYATGKIAYTGIAAGTYSAGATVKYAGVDWLVIKDNGSNVTLITKSNIGTGAYHTTTSIDYGTSKVKTTIDNWFNSNSVLVADKNIGALVADSSTGYYARLPRSNELSTNIPNSSDTPFWTMSSLNTAQIVVALKNGTSLYHSISGSIYSRGSQSTGGSDGLLSSSSSKVDGGNTPAFPNWTKLAVSGVATISTNKYYSSNTSNYELYKYATLCDASLGVTGWTVSKAGTYPVGDSTCKKYTTVYQYIYEEQGDIGYRPVITVKEK